MHNRSLQTAVLNAGSRVFARDDKEGTTTQAIHTLDVFMCHHGLEPGSRMHSRSLQTAVLNAGSRVFARDDKEGQQQRPFLLRRAGSIMDAPLKNGSASEKMLNMTREAVVLAIHENFMREA